MTEQGKPTRGATGRRTSRAHDTVPQVTTDEATHADRDAPTTVEPPVEPATQPSTTAHQTRTTPSPSPRNGVLVNPDTVRTAFQTGDASQSVGYVQHVLRSRGFEPGNVAGIADHPTRTAYARFQESIGERPTGLPTTTSLDFLGFDVLDG